jgi:hypothetical protein
MMAFASVMGGAAPGWNVLTSRAWSQAATLARPPPAYHAHRRAATSGGMISASDHRTNQRRSSDGRLIAARSFENAKTKSLFAAS